MVLVRLVVLYIPRAHTKGLNMNSHANTQLFENWTDRSMPVVPESILPAGHPTSTPKVALIPLVRQAGGPSQAMRHILLQRLIVTVQFDPASVQLRWALDISDDDKLDTIAKALSGASRSNLHFGKANAYDSVQYHLPLTTLNQFTDNQGLPRISTELEDVPCEASIFTRLTQLILPSLESPELF